jgi:hypothetical protein
MRGARRYGLALLACAVYGCGSSGTPPPAGSVYPGNGFDEPWNWGPVYRELPIVVGPPGKTAHPLAPAPRPADRPAPQ